jgi:hypothetical protein
MGCETAQSIAAGGLLTIREEVRLLGEFCGRALHYWPDQKSIPQSVLSLMDTRPGELNTTASEFMAWHSRSLMYITEVVEDAVQRRQQADRLA